MAGIVDGYGFGSGDGFGYGDGDAIGTVGSYAVRVNDWGYVSAGCELHTVDHWREHWRQNAADNGVTVSEAEAERLLAAAEDRLERARSR